MPSLSDQVDKQLADLNQALDALEASVKRVRRFLEARPNDVKGIADEPGNEAAKAAFRVAVERFYEGDRQPKRWGEVYDGGQ